MSGGSMHATYDSVALEICLKDSKLILTRDFEDKYVCAYYITKDGIYDKHIDTNEMEMIRCLINGDSPSDIHAIYMVDTYELK
jgi:hypothetical protein